MCTIDDLNSLDYFSERDKENIQGLIQLGHSINERAKHWMKNNKVAWSFDKNTVMNYSGFLFVFAEDSLYHFKDGKIHRDDDKPAVINKDNEKYWYQNNVLHRVNNPAVIKLDSELWYLNGRRHRIGGPSFYGRGFESRWYVNGLEYDEQEYWNLPQLIHHKLNIIIEE